MQPDDIRQLAAWLAATDIDLLELQGPGLELRLGREAASGTAPMAAALATPSAPSTSSPPSSPSPTAARPGPGSVRAPSVGILRDRPPGRAAPLASAGTAVRQGDLIALLQVGALLLPVRAPANGRLGEWLVAPGHTVGHGTHLVDITS